MVRWSKTGPEQNELQRLVDARLVTAETTKDDLKKLTTLKVFDPFSDKVVSDHIKDTLKEIGLPYLRTGP